MQFHSTERVERDGYLVYAEGDEIPSTDVDELVRQGHLSRSEAVDEALAGIAAPDANPALDAEPDVVVVDDDVTKEELYERATELGISGRSTMSKEQLAAALAAAEQDDANPKKD